MLDGTKCLIVAAVISGRNFTGASGQHLVCEARFNNIVLSTDPVRHIVEPLFEQELAWELDRSLIRQHRLQRSTVKIQIYTVNIQTGIKELVGYFIVDIRSISSQKNYKWYRVLHSKYRKAPEIFCGAYLDSDEPPSPNFPIMAGVDMQLPPDLIPRALPNIDSDNPAAGDQIYVFGPNYVQKETYLLTLSFVNIPNLFHTLSIKQPDEKFEKVTLSCDLFGKHVSSDGLDNCGRIEWFPNEHHFTIRSATDVLRSYFVHISPLKFTLTFGSQKLAEAVTSLESFPPNTHSLQAQPFMWTETVNLIPVSTYPSTKELLDHSKLSVSFKLEVLKPQTTESESYSKLHPPVVETLHHHSPILSEVNPFGPVDFDNETGQVTCPKNEARSGSVDSKPMISITSHVNAELHHFRYIIQLQRLMGLRLVNEKELVYVSYTYPPFGCSVPVKTHPPISLSQQEGDDCLPEGQCTFSFASSQTELYNLLRANPLTVNIFKHSLNNPDSPIGHAQLHLQDVFNEEGSTDVDRNIRFYSGTADISPPLSQNRAATEINLGQLVYKLSLEDLGVYVRNPTDQPYEGTPLLSTFKTSTNDVRSTPEYKAAFELELWRASEESKFQDRLKEREKELISIFAEEWQSRDKEREMLFRKKLAEYQTLENKLRKSLSDLLIRENQLAAGEAELARIRQDTLHEVKLKRRELASEAHTQIRELESQLSLAQSQNDQLKCQVEEWKSTCTSLKVEVSSLRDCVRHLEHTAIQADKQPDRDELQLASQLEVARLSADLNKAQFSLLETERHLDEAQRDRMRYRDLWTRTLHEVARLKQDAEATAQTNLSRREAELERLRSRYLSVEDKELAMRLSTTSGPKSRCRNPLDARFLENKLAEIQNIPPGVNHIGRNSGDNAAKTVEDEREIARLVEERDELLATGMYDSADPIIVGLEQKIDSLRSL